MEIGLLQRVSIWRILLCLVLSTMLLDNSYGKKIDYSSQEIELADALQKLTEKYDVYFTYDKSLVRDVTVNYSDQGNTVEEDLNYLLKGTELQFKIFEDRFVIIYRLDKEGMSSLRSMVEHFSDILEKDDNRSNFKPTKSIPIREAWKPKQRELTGLALSVSGTVKDQQGEVLIGVNVLVKGTTNGTSTDFDGRYTLENVNENATLVFSYIGYQTIEIPVDGRREVEVTMISDSELLEEVVVVGYGTQKKVNLTGSVSSLTSKDLENRPLTNSTQALQGVTGIYVNQAGGQPGKDNATIRIRGQGTFNNNNPLVLVDGIELSLSDVNPNDIESISVLKDAASASIYGNRAANGVILVTTKGGQAGETRISYNNYLGIQSPTYLPETVKDPVRFMELRNIAGYNAGRTQAFYPEEVIEEYRNGVDPYIYPRNDWMDIMFNDAFIQEHNLRISGGSEQLDYSVSLGYLDQAGVLMGTDGGRLSVRSSLNYSYKNWLKLGTDFSVNQRKSHEPATTAGTMMEMVFKAQGFHPSYLEDGSYADTWIRSPGHNVYRHPLVWANEGYLDTENLNGILNFTAQVKLPLGFSYMAKVGFSRFSTLQDRFVPDIYMYQVKTLESKRVDYYTPNKNRHVYNNSSSGLNTTLFNTLTFDKELPSNHRIKAMIGSSYESFDNRYFNALIEGFLGNSLTELNAGSVNPAVNGTSNRNVLIGTFGRFNYDYKDKYLFEVNFRYDGSSRFAKANQWGFFPSLSLGWRLDQEEFLKSLQWISSLKLRGSYGVLGNQAIPDFSYINLIQTGREYLFGGNVNPGVAVESFRDPNISWETTRISNFGIDGSLFNNKIDFNIDVYNKRTDDILRPVSLPSQVGNLGGPIKNIGSVENSGVDFNIIHRSQVGELEYSVNLGVNYNVNEVVDLNDEIIYSGNKFITTEGYPMDSYFVLESDGIFQTIEEINSSPFQNITTKPGYIKYVDQNNDNVINSEDRVITGSVLPDYTYSFGLNLNYKNFSLNTFFQGVKGVDSYPERIIASPFWFATSVTERWVNESWTPDRPDAQLPILTAYEDGLNDNYLISDFWLLDASYLRLKNIQFSYSIPKSILKNIGISNCLVFINGQNLLTMSNMEDFDPERNVRQANYYEYPSVKMFTMGVNVGF